jgi:hypothetical protein
LKYNLIKYSIVTLLFSTILFVSTNLFSQNLDVIGKEKIGTMDKVNSSDSILVRLMDGTLAYRDASTLKFVPYSGATQAVDLGAFDLKVNNLTVGKGGGSLSSNTASGYDALRFNTSGNNNIAYGSFALNSNTTGSNNTAIGRLADVSSGDLTNATAIGANATVNASNKVRIGDAAVTVIEGQIAFSPTSDRRLKEKIVTASLGKDFVNDLNPVQYHRINNSNEAIEMGIIAQELLVVLEKHGLGNSGMVSQPKDPEQYMSVRYNDLLAPMIKAIQELSQENEILKKEMKRINALEEALVVLKEMVSSNLR